MSKECIVKIEKEINGTFDFIIDPNSAITRCKECKYRRDVLKAGHCGCDLHGYAFGLHPLNFFCGDGYPKVDAE